MMQVAIFASGNGSNAQKIAEYFGDKPGARVTLILSNRPDAFVLERAAGLGIPARTFTRQEFYQSEKVLEILKEFGIGFVVLAGFLWLVPGYLLEAYPGRIVNIHPALLPKFGGKGMYGEKVHQAVIANKEKRTGITIHYVNEVYDAGQIIFQDSFPVLPEDTPESIASRVHALEYKHYPKIIEQEIMKLSIDRLRD
jgi:phosphoribosylglycinamide formyltransferase-1